MLIELIITKSLYLCENSKNSAAPRLALACSNRGAAENREVSQRKNIRPTKNN